MAEIFFPSTCLVPIEQKYQTIKDFLHQHSLAVVEFVKKNGEKRVMSCTLSLKLIPESQRPKSVQSEQTLDPPTVDMETISVFCTDLKEWRSFKTSNVISIRTPEPIVEQLEVVAGEGDELLITFSEEMLARVGWKPGDELVWTVNENGQVTLSKKEEE